MDPRIEKLLKLPLHFRVLILFGVVVVIGIAFYFLFFMPQVDEYKRLGEEYQVLDRKLQEDRRIAADLPKFKIEYERMQTRLDEALAELPNQKEIPTLLTSISALAKDQGLEIIRFRPMGEVVKGFYAEVPVEIKLSGRFHDVAMFFDSVGKLPRIVNIGNLSLGSPKISEGQASVSVDCVATTFRFVDTSSSEVKPGKQ